MTALRLYDDGYCFACGLQNPSGLRLEFRYEGGKAFSEFVAEKMHQGFKDIVHGGIITAVLDEAMVKAVLAGGTEAVTAEIVVRFKAPLYIGERSFIEAEIRDVDGRLIQTAARITKGVGVLVAEAKAKLMRNV
jgi:acyl-coenzyme A thioesterase PaaI-like protein